VLAATDLSCTIILPSNSAGVC